jgi:hypothetical protein
MLLYYTVVKYVIAYTIVKHASWVRYAYDALLTTVDDTAIDVVNDIVIDIADDTGNERVDDMDPILIGYPSPRYTNLEEAWLVRGCIHGC